MPMPEPPGGTMGVTFSSGSLDIFSKKSAMIGCSCVCFSFIIMNSAHPGTNIGRTYCLCRSAFSQLYSIIPITDISSKSCCTLSLSLPLFFAISSSVIGFLTFMERQTSAISSVSTSASPQYSGSSTVTLWPIRSVIICPSFRISVLSSLITLLLSNSTFLIFYFSFFIPCVCLLFQPLIPLFHSLACLRGYGDDLHVRVEL